MTHASIAKQLAVIQKALQDRAPRWAPAFEVLAAGEEVAKTRFLAAHVYRAPYSGNDRRDKQDAIASAFERTRVGNMRAPRFVGFLLSGVGSSLPYFNAIFNNMGGGHRQTLFRPEHSAAPPLSSCVDLPDRFKRTMGEVMKNLDALQKAVLSAPKEIPSEHAENALAAMLLAPLLYPPVKPPDAVEVAVLMEWTMWCTYVPLLSRETRQDQSRKRARHSELVDLSGMFFRLKELALHKKVKVPPEMSNLDQFRRNWEEAGEAGVTVMPKEIDMPIPAPAAVSTWIAADDAKSRDMVRNASRHIRPAEARL
ncbi:MAG: hypothetical protein JNL98_15980 [Bryobacterales bacterium]|nr:hypothetical protein [Bryobacterales bacterium]